MHCKLKNLCLVPLLVLLSGTFFAGCPMGPEPEPTCVDGVSLIRIEPQGRVCTTDCECNNLLYHGTCKGGKCQSTPRASCSKPGETQTCPLPKSLGPCAEGKQTCQPEPFTEPVWGDCKVAYTSKPEECNGKDDDCDGKVDEDFPENKDYCTLPNKLGECSIGAKSCQEGKIVCLGKTKQPEVCNGKDDDCDGEVDEEFPEKDQPCSPPSTQGECAKGIQTCNNGKLECKAPQADIETCNGKDDDCDGSIDEEFDRKGEACTPPQNPKGICADGTRKCVAGILKCEGPKAIAEICQDGKDNDCDGEVDEGCASCSPNIPDATLSLPSTVVDFAFNYGGTMIAAISTDKAVHFWQRSSGSWKEQKSLTLSAPAQKIAFDPKNNLFAVALDDQLQLWDLTASPARIVKTWKAHDKAITALTFRGSLDEIVTGSLDRTIKLWSASQDPTKIKLLRSMQRNTLGPIANFHFDNNDSQLYVLDGTQNVHAWNLALGALEQRFVHIAKVTSLAFKPTTESDQLLALGSSDTSITFWEPQQSRYLGSSPRQSYGVTALSYSYGGDTLFAGYADGTIRFWSPNAPSSNNPMLLYTSIPGLSLPIQKLLASPDRKTLAATTGDNFVRVWKCR